MNNTQNTISTTFGSLNSDISSKEDQEYWQFWIVS